MTPTDDPILVRFRSALHRRFDNQVLRAVLFGSRARGDARADSDYDIAVFFKDGLNPWAELPGLADIGIDILDETGFVVNAIPFASRSLQEPTMLMHEIRKDGQDIL